MLIVPALAAEASVNVMVLVSQLGTVKSKITGWQWIHNYNRRASLCLVAKISTSFCTLIKLYVNVPATVVGTGTVTVLPVVVVTV
ncbi:MAG: hypothetical protein IPK57_05680 [Chitinophagaceae bacterium]|nr:hypothetical protein [Chitinophagaceae bacterium]